MEDTKMENVTINGKTFTANRLGNGVTTTAYAVSDKRYNGGKKVLLFASQYDIVKEGISKHLQSTNRLNVHIPRIRRIGVGYDDSNNFCLVYESPFYNVFADSRYGDSVGQKSRLQYETISSELSYGYGGIASTMANVKNASIPTGIKSAMLDILTYADNVSLPESEWYGLDLHSGNGAYDNKGNLILLDVFHNGGFSAQTFVQCYESENEVYIESGRMSDYDRIDESENYSACQCTECRIARGSHITTHTPNRFCNCNECQEWHAKFGTHIIFAPRTLRIRAPRTFLISHGKWHFAPFTKLLRAPRTQLIHAPKTLLVITRTYNIMVWAKWSRTLNAYAVTESDYANLESHGFKKVVDCQAVMLTIHAHNFDNALDYVLQYANDILGSDKMES